MRNFKRECQERLTTSLADAGRMLRCVSGGQMRRENLRLVQRLAVLRAQHNQLKQEMDELLRYADRELSELKQTNTGLAREFDELQLRVWELEQQVDELLLYIAEVAKARRLKAGAMEVEAGPDLAGVNLGIVGGHEATRREVIEELVVQYGLRRWAEVPPTWESSLSKSVLKEKLERCDLIVIITGYMNHSLTHAVFGLKESGALAGEVALLNFRGKSGVVREVLRQVALLG
jgi:predicted RNase H-like nuclease (RuvC/YqgF family)